MPLLKHAKKKLRQDKKRTTQNRKIKETFRSLVKKAKTEKTAESISKAFSGLDIAAKQNIIHKNKAARMKSSLSKLVNVPATVAKTEKTEKKPVKAKSSTSSSPVKKSAGTTKKKSSTKA